MVNTFKKETSVHQNAHTRSHHASMEFSEVAFVNGFGFAMRGESAVKYRCKKAPAIAEASRQVNYPSL